MSIEDIKARDAEAVPRLGKPDEDPLLRAEMDRRDLLEYIDALEKNKSDYSTSISAAELRDIADLLDALQAAEEISNSLASRRGVHSSVFYNEYTYEQKVKNDDFLFPVIAADFVLGQIGIGDSGKIDLWVLTTKFDTETEDSL